VCVCVRERERERERERVCIWEREREVLKERESDRERVIERERERVRVRVREWERERERVRVRVRERENGREKETDREWTKKAQKMRGWGERSREWRNWSSRESFSAQKLPLEKSQFHRPIKVRHLFVVTFYSDRPSNWLQRSVDGFLGCCKKCKERNLSCHLVRKCRRHGVIFLKSLFLLAKRLYHHVYKKIVNGTNFFMTLTNKSKIFPSYIYVPMF
jgi:hypothetical protein